ncbi:MAG: prephenate dehydrogenase [bacterium]|nr:prephenate dehydrogenase [bacterium]
MIIGLGLIGGSIARSIKKKNKRTYILAYDKNIPDLKKALKEKVIDEYFIRPHYQYFHVDLIIFALPIKDIQRIFKKFQSYIRPETLITDTASTKQTAQKIFRSFPHFTGSHPLAGSEKNGYIHSHGDILKNKICILCPGQPASIMRLKHFWNQLGMKVICMNAVQHDQIIGMTSHFIHLLSFAMAFSLRKKRLNVKSLYGPSFQQFIRLAKSNPDLWKDIFIDNKNSINIITDDFIKVLGEFRKKLDHENQLNNILKSSQRYILKTTNE